MDQEYRNISKVRFLEEQLAHYKEKYDEVKHELFNSKQVSMLQKQAHESALAAKLERRIEELQVPSNQRPTTNETEASVMIKVLEMQTKVMENKQSTCIIQ